jgi:hypothetical protein
VTQKGAFTATTPAHNDECLAAINVERDAVDYGSISELSDEIHHFDHWRVNWRGHGNNDEIRMTNDESMTKLE